MQTYPVISSDISAVYNRVSIVMRSSESPVITWYQYTAHSVKRLLYAWNKSCKRKTCILLRNAFWSDILRTLFQRYQKENIFFFQHLLRNGIQWIKKWNWRQIHMKWRISGWWWEYQRENYTCIETTLSTRLPVEWTNAVHRIEKMIDTGDSKLSTTTIFL